MSSELVHMLAITQSRVEFSVQHMVKFDVLVFDQNIWTRRSALFGGTWLPCDGEKNEVGKYPCEVYAEKHKHMAMKFRIRDDPKNKNRKEYYRAGHYDFFQLEDVTNKQDPIIAGPNLEPYCPNIVDDGGKPRSLVGTKDLITGGPSYYGCTFNFQRGICFDPANTTVTFGMEPWQRSALSGNCGPICPATMRPWFPVCALERSDF